MRVKIISDGTTVGTKVINEETGEPVGLIQSIVWSVDVDKTIAECTVKLIKVPVEIVTSVLTVEQNQKPEAWPICLMCGGQTENFPNAPSIFYCLKCNFGEAAQELAKDA